MQSWKGEELSVLGSDESQESRYLRFSLVGSCKREGSRFPGNRTTILETHRPTQEASSHCFDEGQVHT